MESFSHPQQLQYSVNSNRFKRLELGVSGSALVQEMPAMDGVAEMGVDHIERLANQAQLVATPIMTYPPSMLPQYQY